MAFVVFWSERNPSFDFVIVAMEMRENWGLVGCRLLLFFCGIGRRKREQKGVF